jgi:hypothetical protein
MNLIYLKYLEARDYIKVHNLEKSHTVYGLDFVYTDKKTNTEKNIMKHLVAANGTTNIKDQPVMDTTKLKKQNYKYQFNNLFEILNKDNRKIYFDIDFKPHPTTSGVFDIMMDKLHECVCYELGIALPKPMIFIRKETDKSIHSAHIIYPEYKTKKSEQLELAKYIQSIIPTVDTKVYDANRKFNLPFNSKFKYITLVEDRNRLSENSREFIPYNIYTENLIQDEPTQYFINNTDGLKSASYSKIYGNSIDTGVVNGPSVFFNSDDITDIFIAALPTEFYTNDWYYWKLLSHYIYASGGDYLSWFIHSGEITKVDCSTQRIQEYINNNFKNGELPPNHIVYHLNKKYSLNLTLNINDDTDEFINWVADLTNSNYDAIKTEISKFRLSNISKKTKSKSIIINDCKIIINEQILLKGGEFFYYSVKHINYKNAYSETATLIPIAELSNIITDELNQSTIQETKKLYSIRAKWGTGKSHHLVRAVLVIAAKTKRKVLIITENNTLNKEYITKFEEFNIISHLEEKNESKFIYDTIEDKDGNEMWDENGIVFIKRDENIYSEYDVVVCSLESIAKLQNIQFDFVILDEFETIMSHFSSPTMIKQSIINTNNNFKKSSTDYTIFKIYKKINMNAKVVLMLDADIQIHRVKLMERIVCNIAEKFECIENKFATYKHNIYYDEAHMSEKLIDDINSGKKIAFCSNSKKQVDIYYKMLIERCPTVNIALISGDEFGKIYNGETKLTEEISKDEFRSNIEEILIEKNINVWLYTSVISTGISINSAIFNKLYVKAEAVGVCNSRILIQMLYRNRILIDEEINIFCGQKYTKYNSTNSDRLNDRILITQRLITTDKQTGSSQDTDIDYLKLRNLNDFESQFSAAYFNTDLITRLKQHGQLIEFINNDASNENQKEISASIKNNASILKQQKLEILTTGDIISSTLANELMLRKKTETLNSGEYQKLSQYFLFKLSGLYQYDFNNFNTETDNFYLTDIIKTDEPYIQMLINNSEKISNVSNILKNNYTSNINELIHINNNDEIIIIYKTINRILEFFNAVNMDVYIKICEFEKLILDNITIIQSLFVKLSELVKIPNINFDKKTNTDVVAMVIKVLKNLTIYGVEFGKIDKFIVGEFNENIKKNEYKYSYSNKQQHYRLVNNMTGFIRNNNFENAYFSPLIKYQDIKQTIREKLINKKVNKIKIYNYRRFLKDSNVEVFERYNQTYKYILGVWTVDSQVKSFLSREPTANIYDLMYPLNILKTETDIRNQMLNALGFLKNQITYIFAKKLNIYKYFDTDCYINKLNTPHNLTHSELVIDCDYSTSNHISTMEFYKTDDYVLNNGSKSVFIPTEIRNYKSNGIFYTVLIYKNISMKSANTIIKSNEWIKHYMECEINSGKCLIEI